MPGGALSWHRIILISIWASDAKSGVDDRISYIRTYENWLYLVVVLDLFSRQVVGWTIRAAWIGNWLSTL